METIKLAKELVEMFNLDPYYVVRAMRKISVERNISMVEAQEYMKNTFKDINKKNTK